MTVYFYYTILCHKVKNLGVYLQSNLSIDQPVNLLRRSVFLELRRTGHLRRHLSVDATKKLVSSFDLSRPDYCNSLLAALPEKGWIACREYKTMQLVLSLADEGETTQSLCSDPSTFCQSEIGLNTSLMTVPRIKLTKYGKRAFSYIGPVTWNSLPKYLHGAPNLFLKSNLKTVFFKRHLYWGQSVRSTRVLKNVRHVCLTSKLKALELMADGVRYIGHQGRFVVVAVVSIQARQSSTGRFWKLSDNFIQGSVSLQRTGGGFLTGLKSNTL